MGLIEGHAAGPDIIVDRAPLKREVKAMTSHAGVIKRVAPSVVNIYTTKIIKMPDRPAFQFRHPFFDDLFGGGDQDESPTRRTPSRREQSLGSGVIISSDGYILSNFHVVEGADEIRVALSDGQREFQAKIVGSDPQTDIAVLKVDASSLPALPVTDSDQLEVGDVVLAVGNPFGVGQTVTMGIVSATGRGGFGIVDYEDFIQTDAAINPGNSGGALVDVEGRLVGINTAIISRSGGSQGIGFSIPINMARGVMDRLLKDGKVTRGYLGVILQEVSPDLAKEFGLEEASGAIVADVSPKTPAAEAGIQEGDVIVEFNGKKVADMRQLRLAVSQTAPETKVQLKLVRDKKSKTVSATLGELPSDLTAARRGPSAAPEKDALEGVIVGDLDARTRRQFNLPSDLEGALVTEVEPESASARAGLRTGDIILEINRKPVKDADQAVALSKKITGDRVLLRVWTRGAVRFIIVDNTTKR